MNHCENSSGNANGFTMIELLVVTAIIGVLVSLLLPTLQQAKEKGKAADCANNLRQVFIAFAMHADDHDDYFPHTYYWWRTLGSEGYLGAGEYHGGATTPGPSGWAYKEQRWPAFRCKGEKGAYFNTSDTNCKQPNPLVTGFDSDLDHCSYALQWSINRYCGYYAGYCGVNAIYPRRGFANGTPDCKGGRGAAPLVMDKCAPFFGWVPNCQEWNIDNPNPYVGSGCGGGCYYAFRHPGNRANVLYLDGHVDTWRSFVETGNRNWVDVWLTEPGQP